MEHIVTPEQLRTGNLEYRECAGVIYVVEHGWIVLRRLPDGNYLVREPELQEAGDYEVPCSQQAFLDGKFRREKHQQRS